MGVKGLTTFFKQNPHLSKSFKLRNSKVILDGNNILHALYRKYEVDFVYGGDFETYANRIRHYMSAFVECNIKPIVIFDGAHETSDLKVEITLARSKDRLKQVQQIVKGYRSGLVLPILAYDGFFSVLIEFEVPFAQCDYEADDQIAALANHFECPVISGDSDFYIFDIHNGFIHFDSIDIRIIDSGGKETKFLKCEIYEIKNFVSFFPGLDKKALPLFGTLIGYNDSESMSMFENFFANVKFPTYEVRGLIVNEKQNKMIGLLSWLQHKTLNTAIEQIIYFYKKEEQEHIKSAIENSVDQYKLNDSNLSLVINKNITDLKKELLLNSRLSTPCGSFLPVDFVVAFHQGHFPPFFMNVIVLHKIFLPCQVENIYIRNSSYSSSLYIRQILYGILVRHNTKDGTTCENQACLSPIDEHERDSFQKKPVNPVFYLEGLGALPKLNEIPNLTKDNCKDILLKILGIRSDFFIYIPGPGKWQLYIGCINYWLRNCKIQSILKAKSQAIIYALTLNLMYFSLIKSKNFLTSKFSYINEPGLEYVEKKLEKYSYEHEINSKNPFDLDIIHCYSQLQACILHISFLNMLLGNTLENPAPEMCFSGIMLYNMTKDISAKRNQDLFIESILGRNSNLWNLFVQLNGKMCENVLNDCISKGKDVSSRRKHKKLKNPPSNNVKGTNSSNKFAVLCEIEL